MNEKHTTPHRVCLLLTLVLGAAGMSMKAPEHYVSYVKKYYRLAIGEMVKSGVPASITLGQALLESNGGTSEMAQQTNNHFSIKCRDWTGPTYRKTDDERDENGRLKESCFRVYETVWESYRDHSTFLRNSPNYRRLFDELDMRNYKAWAYGLQACRYATDADYANKLIRVIEENELYRYDDLASPYLPIDEIMPATVALQERDAPGEPVAPVATAVQQPFRAPAPGRTVLPKDYKRGDGLRQ